MSEEMQLALEHTLKTMRELKEAKAEIERLRAFAEAVIRYAGNACDDYLADKARAVLAEEKKDDH